jgi:hypothetical protein
MALKPHQPSALHRIRQQSCRRGRSLAASRCRRKGEMSDLKDTALWYYPAVLNRDFRSLYTGFMNFHLYQQYHFHSVLHCRFTAYMSRVLDPHKACTVWHIATANVIELLMQPSSEINKAFYITQY